MKRPDKSKPAIQHGEVKDISNAPADSINGRFHALGFSKHYELDGSAIVHVYTRGSEFYESRNSYTAIAQLESLEQQS